MKDDAASARRNDCGHNAAEGTLVPCKRAGVIGARERGENEALRDKRTLFVTREKMTSEKAAGLLRSRRARAAQNHVTECRTFDENSSG
jgi:hypothetical protein